jgi:hypothetical protein
MMGTALIALAVALAAAGCVAPAASVSTPSATPSIAPAPSGTMVAIPTLTPIPGLKATITALPKQPPMSSEQARPYIELRAAVEECGAYNENRKLAILNQIDYVVKPSTVPSDFVVLYGSEWPGRMIYGAAYLSALEWKLAGQSRTSCLYHIGVSFNTLLRQLGQSPFPEFE